MKVFNLPAGAVGLLERSADWRRGSEIVLIGIVGSSKFVRLNILAICRRKEAEVAQQRATTTTSWALAVLAAFKNASWAQLQDASR